VDIDLAELTAQITAALAHADGRTGAADHLHAELAACCAQPSLGTPTAAEVANAIQGLSPEEIGRLLLALRAVRLPAVRANLGATALPFVGVCVQLAQATPLLSRRLLRQSPLRREEFARQLIARLGATVRGEPAEQTRRELVRLDYGRLVAEAERAKWAADQRLDWLRQLQQEQDRRRPRPRGKWW